MKQENHNFLLVKNRKKFYEVKHTLATTIMSLTEEIFSVTLSCLCITTLTLFCAILRYLKRTYLPTNYQFITEEFICTFQIVAGVKEGDIVLDSTNNAAYFVFLFALFASFGLSFEESDVWWKNGKNRSFIPIVLDKQCHLYRTC